MKRIIISVIAVLVFAATASAYTVQKTADVVYGKGWVTSPAPGLKDLLLDVYYPQGNDAANKTAIIFIHGGGFDGGGKGSYALPGVNYFCGTRGHVVFNINYRMIADSLTCPNMVAGGNRTQQAAFAAAVDAKRAVRWVRAKADSFGIDPERVVCLGGSAGAYTCVVIGVADADTFVADGPDDPGIPYGNPDENGKPNAIVEMFGYSFTWLPTYISLFDSADAPVCAMCGDNDVAVPFPYYYDIRTRCRRADIPHDFYVIEDGIHGQWFDSTNVWVDMFLEDHLYNPVSSVGSGTSVPAGAPDGMPFPETLSVKTLRMMMQRQARAFDVDGRELAAAGIRPGVVLVRMEGFGVQRVVVIP